MVHLRRRALVLCLLRVSFAISSIQLSSYLSLSCSYGADGRLLHFADGQSPRRARFDLMDTPAGSQVVVTNHLLVKDLPTAAAPNPRRGTSGERRNLLRDRSEDRDLTGDRREACCCAVGARVDIREMMTKKTWYGTVEG